MHRINSNVDTGHPCFTDLETFMYSVSQPLFCTVIFGSENKVLIYLM